MGTQLIQMRWRCRTQNRVTVAPFFATKNAVVIRKNRAAWTVLYLLFLGGSL